MKLALRWIAFVIAIAGITWFWLGRDSTSLSSAAMPEESARVEAAVPHELSNSASSSVAPERVADVAEARVEAAAEPQTAPEPAQTALIRVRVFAKETNAPLAGRLIVARPEKATTWSTSTTKLAHAEVGEAPTTDEHGRAEFTVVARTAHIVTLLDRMQGDKVEVPALEPGATFDAELGITTEADLFVIGRVIDAETRAAIAGASVSAELDPRRSHVSAIEPTRSDELGYFEIRAKSWETRLLRVEAENYPWVVIGIGFGHSSRDDALEVPMTRAAAAEVVVLESGRAAANAKVTLSTKSYNLQVKRDMSAHFFLDQDPSWSATTEVNGVARFAGLPARVPLQILVAHQGRSHFESTPVVLEPTEMRRIEVQLGSGVTITGRIQTSSGVAVRGAEIWRVTAESNGPTLLSPYTDVAAKTRSNDEGRFVFEDVGAGDWWIGAAPQRTEGGTESLAPFAEHVAVRGDEVTLDIVVRTDIGLYIRGTVLDADGKPTDSGVSVINEALGLWEYANAGATHEFAAGPLLQAEYKVSAGGFGASGVRSNEVIVPAGTEDVVLQLGRAGRMTVRIAPVGGDTVDAELLVALTGVPYGWSITSTRNGVRTYDELSPGTFSVSAKTVEGLCAFRSGIVVTAEGPPTEVELVLERGAVLQVRYVGPDKVCNCSLYANGIVVDSTGFERGTVEMLVGPAGTVELHRWTGKDTPPEVYVLTLGAGEKREIVLGK